MKPITKILTTINMKSNKNKRLVLLDAHAILHRSYHGMPEFTDRNGQPVGALYGYISMIARIKNDLKPDYMAACYDLPRPTFRHLAYDNYKGTRSATDEALKSQIDISYDICKGLNIPIYKCEGFEADDLLGTIAEIMKMSHPEVEVIIASGDMDTMQLIDDNVKVYTLKKANETVLYGSAEVYSKYGFYPNQIADYKAIAGDTSDNIIGVPGIGVKGATDLIQRYNDLDNIYKNIEKENFDYKKEGLRERLIKLLIENKDSAYFSKTLATIRLDVPITFIPTMWSVDAEVYRALCDRFNFKSLRNKFDDYMDDKPVSLDDDKPIVYDEYAYRGLKTMMNLYDSEMVNIKVADILENLNVKSTEDAENKLKEILTNEKINLIIPNDNGMCSLYDYYQIVEYPIVKIIKHIEESGIQVNAEMLRIQSKKLHEIIIELEKSIYNFAGGEFNINSPKQLADIIYDKLNLGEKIKKTKTGQRSTNMEMLNSLRDEHEIIDKIIKYRELYKLVSTYIDTLPDYIKEDGKIHSKLILNGAATGRFSSEHPNLQNLPAKSGEALEIRKAFTASYGHKLLSLDYSQIELRLAAILSGDEALLQIFRDGIDVHAGVAALVYDKLATDINNDERRHAKAINFGILYGMGVNALKDSMGVERVVAQEFYNKYKERFYVLMNYLDDVKRRAEATGYTETLFGRRRQIPLLRSKLPFMRAQGERIAINAPVQGAGAELIKLAMIDVYRYIQEKNKEEVKEKNNDTTNLSKTTLETKMNIKMIMQVHDELIFEIKEDDNTSAKEIKNIMENVLKKRGIDIIPIAVGVSEGHNLFELK